MKEPEIHPLWVTRWVIIEGRSFLNKHVGGYTRGWIFMKQFNIFMKYKITNHLILAYLLYFYGYCYFFCLKYYTDLS